MFVAPGPEGEPLQADGSPWIDDRWTSIPLEDWNTIREFAASLDEEAVAGLWRQSGGSGFVEVIDDDAADLAGSIDFLERVAAELETAPPLVPEPTEEQPEAYPNEELARMTRNVKAVMAEALRRNEPFRAWSE